MVSIDNIFGLFSHDDKDLSKGENVTYIDFKSHQNIIWGCIKSLF